MYSSMRAVFPIAMYIIAIMLIIKYHNTFHIHNIYIN